MNRLVQLVCVRQRFRHEQERVDRVRVRVRGPARSGESFRPPAGLQLDLGHRDQGAAAISDTEVLAQFDRARFERVEHLAIGVVVEAQHGEPLRPLHDEPVPRLPHERPDV